jgi:hypothetical protein
MKKKLAFLGSTLALASSLMAQDGLSIKGNSWQLFGFNEEIDLIKSFAGSPVKIIWAYDNANENWVAYSPQYAMKVALEDANYTVVDKLMPNQGFWVQSYEDINVSLEPVFKPLFEMCVDVKSPLFWANTTDENGVALTTPYAECETFIAELPPLEVTEMDMVIDSTDATQIKGYFKTNLPVIFAKDLTTNQMVAVEDIADAYLPQFIDANGSISNVTFVSSKDEATGIELTDFNFTLDTTADTTNYSSMKMFIGVTDNPNDAIELTIPFPAEMATSSN